MANKPLIFYPVETLANIGVKEIAITYNPGYLEAVKNLLGDGHEWGLKFTYVLQEKPIGLANIVEVCEDFIGGDDFIFHLGDNIFVDGLKEVAEYFRKNRPNGLITMIHHPQNNRMWVPYFDKRGKLVKNVEKPENPPHDWAVPGVYFADKNFFKAFKGPERIKPSPRGEYEITAPFQWLIDHNYKVEAVEYKGKWLDPGKFDDWIIANECLLDKNVVTRIDSKLENDTIIENRVAIGKNCRISNSTIRGPVIIGDGVTIESSYIGPYTSICDNVEILSSHVENSVIMENAKISQINVPIDSSLIGAGSVVTNSTTTTRSYKMFVGSKCQIQL